MALQRLKKRLKSQDGTFNSHGNGYQSSLYHRRCQRPKHLNIKLSRAKLEMLVEDLVEK